MKYSHYFGVGAAVLMVVSCFLKWTWHPDIQQYFTGFYSHENIYGKPGKALIFFAIVASVFYLVPKLWAKRWNLLVCALNLGYAIKTFILFSSCYRGICPDKHFGIWLMLISSFAMMLAAVLPKGKVKEESER